MRAAGAVPSKASAALVTALVLLGALGLAALFGFAASLGQMLIVAVLLAPLGLLALLALRIEWVVWLLFASATLLGGTLSYFAKIGQAQWLPIGVGTALYVLLLLRVATARRGEVAAPLSVPVLLGAALACVAVLSTAWSAAEAGQWIYGFRYYFTMGSLFLTLALLPLPDPFLRRLWIAFGAVVLVQLPVAIYQYIVVAGRRVQVGTDGVAWDAIVGTMGGNQEGGGHSAAMGFFVLSGFVLAFAMWKRGLLGTSRMLAFAAVVLAVIFLAEVKFMVILLPIAVALVLRVQLLARIKPLLMGLAVVAVLAVAMPVLYSKLHYERSGKPAVSVAEFYQKIVDSTDPEKVNEGTGQMGRVTQIVFWWNEQDLAARPKEFLIGHGVAATNVARINVGTVAKQYFPLPVGNTSGVLMLWEIGVVGVLLSIGALCWLAWQSLRLSARSELPAFHRAALDAGAAILLMLVPALFYKHFALKSPAVQFLLFMAAGQVCYWQARLALAARTGRASVPWFRLRPGALAPR